MFFYEALNMDLKDSLIKKGGLSKIDEALLNSSKDKSSADESLKEESLINESSADESLADKTPKNNFSTDDSSAHISSSSSQVSAPVSPSHFHASVPVSSYENTSYKKTSHEPELLSKPVRLGVEGDYKEHVVNHLAEFRNRLIVSGIILILGLVIIYPFSGGILDYLWEHFIPPSVIMSIYSPTEFLMTRLKLSAALSFCIFFPFFMYQLFKFMSRGLYKNERRFLLKVVPLSFIIFLLGVCLAYFIVLPIFLNYILFYSDKTAVAQVGLAETISTIISLVLGFGMVFQVPLLMVAVVRMGIVEEKTLRKGRLVVYGALIGFTFLIAPDPTFISQLIAGLALVVLFEISLILLKIV
jgi:sec-independent protein translocase protein TatC